MIKEGATHQGTIHEVNYWLFCVFRLIEQVVFEHNYCFWIILSIKWTYFLTTVYSIAQNLIWSNDIFLTNCVNTAYFLISQCPYTSRMVETLSLYLLMVANDVKKIFLSQMKWHFMKHRELLEFLTYSPQASRYKLLKKVESKSDTL